MHDAVSKNLFKLWALVLIGLLTAIPASANVKISSVDDINLGQYSGSGSIDGESHICIYNSESDDYAITITSTIPENPPRYLLRQIGGSGTIEVDVYFKGSSGTFLQHDPNYANGYTGADRLSTSCSGGTNATLKINISEFNLLGPNALAGTYTMTLTILLVTN